MVVGSHQAVGHSMRRYSTLIENFYDSSDISFKVITPTDRLSALIRNPELKKWVIYFESYILFLPVLVLNSQKFHYVHFIDLGQSLSRYAIRRSKLIITCHDLFGLEAARGEHENVSIRKTGKLFQRIVNSNLKSLKLLTVSEYSAKSIQDSLNISDVTVVYNPLDKIFQDSKNIQEVSGNFALIVMNATWRKQRYNSVKFWKEISGCQDFSQLVIIGEDLTLQEKQIVGLDNLERVKVFKNLSDEELVKIYSECSILIHLSNLEGFGWPIIEANSQGKLAVYSSANLVANEVYDSVNVSLNTDAYGLNELTCLKPLDLTSSITLSQRTKERFSLTRFHNDMYEYIKSLD